MRIIRTHRNICKKISYCSPLFWKKLHVYNKLPILKPYDMKIHSRSSIIPENLLYCEAKIHKGNNWYSRIITRWNIGFKFGEFTWNRKLAVYKAKQLRKKKKINKKTK